LFILSSFAHLICFSFLSDSYGATNPAEFFAVATETFFEKPIQLSKKHQALYELLQRYYRLDPLQWQKVK